MSYKVTPDIEKVGYGLSGDIGGLPRTTYFTPDGRVIKAIPSMRDYVIKDKDGKVTGSGVRDANLDRGWLLTPPVVRELFCRGCDKWHHTPEEVKSCIERTEHYLRGLNEKYKSSVKKEVMVSKLEARIAALEAELAKKEVYDNRKVFQSTDSESGVTPITRKIRGRKEAVHSGATA